MMREYMVFQPLPSGETIPLLTTAKFALVRSRFGVSLHMPSPIAGITESSLTFLTQKRFLSRVRTDVALQSVTFSEAFHTPGKVARIRFDSQMFANMTP